MIPAAIQSFDENVLLLIQENIRCSLLTPLMVFFSKIGDNGYIWIALGLLLIAVKRTRGGGLTMAAGLVCEAAFCDLILKKIFLRPRPYLILSQLTILVPPEHSTSFPSGHTASSFVCAWLLTKYFGRKGALAWVPAVIIALSRMYVGVHYPSDVFCGAILGILVGISVWEVTKIINHKKNKKKAAGP